MGSDGIVERLLGFGKDSISYLSIIYESSLKSDSE